MPETFQLKKPIGPNHVVDPDDVVRIKTALVDLGFLEVPEEGVTPWPGRPTIHAVADFQREKGLPVDGVINPGGPTQQAINQSLAARRNVRAPSNGGAGATRTGVNAPGPTTPARWAEINKRLEKGAQRITTPIMKEVAKNPNLWFDPKHGARPIHTMPQLGNAELRAGPPSGVRDWIADTIHPGLVRSELGDVGVADFVPGLEVGTAVEDVRHMRARERAGFPVGVGEKIGTYAGVPLSVFGLGILGKGGKLADDALDGLSRRLSEPFRKGLPVQQGHVDDYLAAVRKEVVKAGWEKPKRNFELPVRPSSPEENMRLGQEALEHLIINPRQDLRYAMHRDDVGGIAFFWGKPGNPAKDFKGGSGFSHIIAKRAAQGYGGVTEASRVVETIAKGRLFEIGGPPPARRAAIVRNGFRAVLSLYDDGRSKTWVLTGFEEWPAGKSGP